ncbi:MAG: ABC transporter ATP-binding protein [Caldibacillus debilis]|jgi:ABC-2 type transport system ATP-binding protein|uniref:ABC-type multidrug transport system, ATPase component n=2 Tax=Caldibacillus debilis TaxID=301148 RepID=A0A420VCN2_9BACI|nr:ABC transporter ATP-binding protein [Caldibacillus debilis]MBO2481329.1 ABC transporter ATP-binding protein [Bacillaceae bacterium]KYD10311.1 hypothetical protein B4135_3486 [Caldibacillus debilis]MBY6271960.1 ABC transporter ATP-binding protein [Bacillaceae bacterium]REJ17807.1 MAG: ABC transporter ATP-binding protein [Caldibacillus debilis]RKO61286.1 ABC-type multidrug transport system, ATPase component [Caldibacillus debilis GB1]
MLETLHLTKQFKRLKAVDDVNLHLNKGEIVGLLGPNGAGKSTTISIISTLMPPTSGEVLLEGESVLQNPGKIRKIMGVVPQEIALYNDFSARENLHFFGRIYRMSGERLNRKIDEVLEIIGLSERPKDLVKTFSGGMKRRLNIGAALLHDPEFLIMDEPTVGIDPQSRNYILETVKRLNEEKRITVLYTSHYMEEVEFLCDRIYIMDQGRIIAHGTKEELKRLISGETTILLKVGQVNERFMGALGNHPVVKNFTAEDNHFTILTEKEGNVFSHLFKLAEETDTDITSVEIKTPTLEDVFLHLTGKALRD